MMKNSIKKILLVNVADPWLTNGGDRPSLGTLYIASWIREKGFGEPSVIDMNHSGEEGLLKRIEDFCPDLIGISLTTPQYLEAVSTARLIKKHYPTMPIMAGGPHPTAMQNVSKHPELMPIDCFDYVVVGPGERTLEKICVEGLPDKRIIYGIPLPTEKILDWLPMPARDLVDMEKYSLKIMGRKAQPLMTSFGCVFSCVFCSEPILNRFFKYYTPERVVKEMMHLKETYGTEAFVIYDDIYSIRADRVVEIGKLMMKENLNVLYRCTTRATDFIRNPELLPVLRDSGCVEICLGTESGSDEILKTADKGMDVETNAKAIEAIQGNGMRVLTYMICGLPGVSLETEQASYDFIVKNAPDEVAYYLLAPFPSTPLWVHRDKYGVEIFEDEIISNNWDVAQCISNNEELTCYLSYEKIGGLNRDEIKDLWLKYRNKYNSFLKERGKRSIQDSDIDLMSVIK